MGKELQAVTYHLAILDQNREAQEGVRSEIMQRRPHLVLLDIVEGKEFEQDVQQRDGSLVRVMKLPSIRERIDAARELVKAYLAPLRPPDTPLGDLSGVDLEKMSTDTLLQELRKAVGKAKAVNAKVEEDD